MCMDKGKNSSKNAQLILLSTILACQHLRLQESLFGPMEFSIKLDTIKSGYIVYIEGSQSKKEVKDQE